uniref:Uncharacterized protein n=1 Tax=Arundo donax TaxID=35708 RepID=A0A0A9F6C6_ARUDO
MSRFLPDVAVDTQKESKNPRKENPSLPEEMGLTNYHAQTSGSPITHLSTHKSTHRKLGPLLPTHNCASTTTLPSRFTANCVRFLTAKPMTPCGVNPSAFSKFSCDLVKKNVRHACLHSSKATFSQLSFLLR